MDVTNASSLVTTMGLNRPDIERARTMFSKACRVHHPSACNALAELCRDARGGPRDLPRAATLFGIACEKGDIQSACTERGLALYDGEGVKEDKAAAVAIFDSACQHETDSQPKACASLGIAYLNGKGVERRDEEKAIELIRRSCEADYAPGCVQMGEMYAKRTRGIRRENLTTAADSYDTACDIDGRFGCFELAQMHEQGRAIEASPEKAAIYYQRTCNIDPTRGCFEAAKLMSSGKVEARDGEIAALYNVACEHGHNEACALRSPE